jgi:hypothetical protein
MITRPGLGLKRAVKNAEHFDALGLHEVDNAVMLIEENSNVPLRTRVALAHLRELDERLGTVVDRSHRLCGCVWVVLRDELEDVFELTQRFVSPN